MWNKLPDFTGGYVFLALGRPTDGLPVDQGSLYLCKLKVICHSGSLRRRQRCFPEQTGNIQAVRLTWRASSIMMPIKIKTSFKLEDPESRNNSLNSSSHPQMGGSHQLLAGLFCVVQGATECRSLITQPTEIH